MSKNNSKHSDTEGCFPFLLLIVLFCWSLFGSLSYIYMKPKDEIKEEIIRQGDEISISNEELSKYIDVLEDLDLKYKVSKDSDSSKTVIKIDRPNK